MASGSYIFIDVRNFPKIRDKTSISRHEHGIVVSDRVINLVTNVSINQYMINKSNNNNNIKNNNNNLGNILVNEILVRKNISINIFPSSTYNITKTGILGPNSIHNTARCRDLVYYQFRLMTMSSKDHRYYCDRNVIIRKPTTFLNGKLLTDFIEHDGTSYNGYFPTQFDLAPSDPIVAVTST
jgi:hypothetical protein